MAEFVDRGGETSVVDGHCGLCRGFGRKASPGYALVFPREGEFLNVGV